VVTIGENDLNGPPVVVNAPPDPGQPLAVSVQTPAGAVQFTLEEVQSSGMITVQVSVAPPSQPPGAFSLLGFYGERIVTLLVYARLRDANGDLLCSSLSLSDDIIYDPLAPTITGLSLQSLQAAATGGQGPNALVLVIDALDQAGGSGVAAMQTSSDPAFGGAAWQPYTATTAVNAQPGETLYVRVRDGVGNLSAVAGVVAGGEGPGERVHLPLIVR
jgi:hypothetical protein